MSHVPVAQWSSNRSLKSVVESSILSWDIKMHGIVIVHLVGIIDMVYLSTA